MWRALTNTSAHFSNRTSRKNHKRRYPNSAPPREEKINSPEPMVSDAMTAPGPKMVSHASGLRDCNANGSGGELTPGLSVEAELISSRLRTPGRSRFEHGRLQRPSLQPAQ